MKSIPIVTFKTKPDGRPETTATLLQECLKITPEGGFDFALMRARNRVSDAIEKIDPEKAVLELEDADHATAVAAIKGTRWVVNEKHLIQFAELFGL